MAMNDLINRDKLIRCIKAEIDPFEKSTDNTKRKVIKHLRKMQSEIFKTGKWVFAGFDFDTKEEIYRCSICKRSHKEMTDYCPTCKTKMEWWNGFWHGSIDR